MKKGAKIKTSTISGVSKNALHIFNGNPAIASLEIFRRKTSSQTELTGVHGYLTTLLAETFELERILRKTFYGRHYELIDTYPTIEKAITELVFPEKPYTNEQSPLFFEMLEEFRLMTNLNKVTADYEKENKPLWDLVGEFQATETNTTVFKISDIKRHEQETTEEPEEENHETISGATQSKTKARAYFDTPPTLTLSEDDKEEGEIMIKVIYQPQRLEGSFIRVYELPETDFNFDDYILSTDEEGTEQPTLDLSIWEDMEELNFKLVLVLISGAGELLFEQVLTVSQT